MATKTRVGMSTTTTTTVEVKLKPATKKLVAQKLAEFLSIHSAIKELEEDKRKLAKEVEAAYVADKEGHALDAGTQFENIKLKIVRGTTSKLDKKKFVSLGGSLATLERATTKSPRAAYLKVTGPGESDAETDS